MGGEVSEESSNATPAFGEQRLREVLQFVKVGRCVNGVTHDVNNCLGAILAYAELTSMDRTLGPEAHRMVAKIIEAVDRATALVSELTNVARPLKPSVSIVDLRELVRGIVLLREYEYRIRQINLVQNFPQEVPSLSGDPAQMRLALLYLLMNAEEAVMGVERKEIRVAMSVLPEGLELVIGNSGARIGVEEPVFEPFYSTKGERHLGLGLNSARDIVQAHGGHLIYEAERGFVLYLPFQSHAE
jgi:two-component system, NtrC family, sensor kinase